MNTTSVPRAASPGDNSSFTAKAAARAALDLGPLLLHVLFLAQAGGPLRRPGEITEKKWRLALARVEEEGFLNLDRTRGSLPRATLTLRGLEVLQALGVQGDVQGEHLKPENHCGSTVSCKKTQGRGEFVGDQQGEPTCPPPFDPPSYSFRFSQDFENKRERPAGLNLERSPLDFQNGDEKGRGNGQLRLVLAGDRKTIETQILRGLGPTLAGRAGREGTLSSRVVYWASRDLIDQALALASQARSVDSKSIIFRPLAWIDRAIGLGRGSAALAAERARMAEDSEAAAGRAAFQAACLAAGAATPGEREAVALAHVQAARQAQTNQK